MAVLASPSTKSVHREDPPRRRAARGERSSPGFRFFAAVLILAVTAGASVPVYLLYQRLEGSTPTAEPSPAAAVSAEAPTPVERPPVPPSTRRPEAEGSDADRAVERLLDLHRRYAAAYRTVLEEYRSDPGGQGVQEAGQELVRIGRAVNDMEESGWSKVPIRVPALPDDAGFPARERHERMTLEFLTRWCATCDPQSRTPGTPDGFFIDESGVGNALDRSGIGPVPIPGVRAMLFKRELVRDRGFVFAIPAMRHAVEAAGAYLDDEPTVWASSFASAVRELPSSDLARLVTLGSLDPSLTRTQVLRIAEDFVFREMLGASRSDGTWLDRCRQSAPEEFRMLEEKGLVDSRGVPEPETGADASRSRPDRDATAIDRLVDFPGAADGLTSRPVPIEKAEGLQCDHAGFVVGGEDRVQIPSEGGPRPKRPLLGFRVSSGARVLRLDASARSGGVRIHPGLNDWIREAGPAALEARIVVVDAGGSLHHAIGLVEEDGQRALIRSCAGEGLALDRVPRQPLGGGRRLWIHFEVPASARISALGLVDESDPRSPSVRVINTISLQVPDGG